MYESLTKKEKMSADDDRPDDLGGMCWHIASLVPIKQVVFVFITFLIINTSTFVERILSYWTDAIDGRSPTDRGIVIQGLILSMALILFSVFDGANII